MTKISKMNFLRFSGTQQPTGFNPNLGMGPSPHPPVHPLRQATGQFQTQISKLKKSIALKSGMFRIVVHGAKLVCSETLPPKKIQTLIIQNNRAKIEGREQANIGDQKKNINIKPWGCKCKKRPSGSDYLPCDYSPTGPWSMGVKTESSMGESPKAPESKAYELGQHDGLMQANGAINNFAKQPQTVQAIQDAANATGIDAGLLKSFATIESTGNGMVGTNAFGYTGLMQMGGAAASDVGMSISSMTGNSTSAISNNALGGAKYLSQNFQGFGSNFQHSALNGYLAHQQGPTGFRNLMNTLSNNPSTPATRNMLNNFPHRNQFPNGLTHQDFYDYWDGKMDAINETLGTSSGASSELTLIEIAILKCTFGGTIETIDPNQNSRMANPGTIRSLSPANVR